MLAPGQARSPSLNSGELPKNPPARKLGSSVATPSTGARRVILAMLVSAWRTSKSAFSRFCLRPSMSAPTPRRSEASFCSLSRSLCPASASASLFFSASIWEMTSSFLTSRRARSTSYFAFSRSVWSCSSVSLDCARAFSISPTDVFHSERFWSSVVWSWVVSSSTTMSPFFTGAPFLGSLTIWISPALEGAVNTRDCRAFTSPRNCTQSTKSPRVTSAVGIRGAVRPRRTIPKPAMSSATAAIAITVPRRVFHRLRSASVIPESSGPCGAAKHHGACFDARLQHDVGIAHRPGHHSALLETAAAHDPHVALTVLAEHSVQRRHQRAGPALELHIHRRRKVGRQLRVATLDDEESRKGVHLLGESAGDANRRNPLEPAGKNHSAIRVEPHLDRLSHAQHGDIGLVHFGAHLHGRRIHHLEEGHAGAHLVALLHFRHLPALPRGDHHGYAVHRRANGHLFGVGLRVLHGVGCAVALDLEPADLGSRSQALQLIRFPELFPPGARFFQIQLVFLGLDAREDFVLAHVEFGGLHGVYGRRDFGVVVRFGGGLVGLFLLDLLDEIAVLGLSVKRGLDLVLAVEFHQKVASLHRRAGGDHVRNHQSVQVLTGQARGGHRVGLHRFHDAVDTHAAHEIAPFDRGGADRLARRRRNPGAPSGQHRPKHECHDGRADNQTEDAVPRPAKAFGRKTGGSSRRWWTGRARRTHRLNLNGRAT